MHISQNFGLDKLKPLDPTINAAFAWVMGLIFIALVVAVAGYLILVFRSRRDDKVAEKLKTEQDIWFDEHKSILHKSTRQVAIPESSLEYYVCKLVFKNPKVYQDDWDILLAAGEADKKDRAVYFAVDRINGKARRAFEMEDKLLKRSKQKTRLNDNYF
jgi:hypothetical protein